MPLPTVETNSLLNAQTTAGLCLDLGMPFAFDGPPGTGKTTAATHIAVASGLEHRSVLMPENPSPLNLLRAIVRELTGTLPVGTGSQLRCEAVDELKDWNGLLIIDEAQNIGPGGMAELQHLYDKCEHKFQLLLAGHGCIEVLDRREAMASRVLGRVHFTELSRDEVLEWYVAIDDFAAGVKPDVVQYTDDIYARGNLRRWTHAHTIFTTYNDSPKKITKQTVRDLVALVGQPPRPPAPQRRAA